MEQVLSLLVGNTEAMYLTCHVILLRQREIYKSKTHVLG